MAFLTEYGLEMSVFLFCFCFRKLTSLFPLRREFLKSYLMTLFDTYLPEMLYFPDSEKKAGCAWALQLLGDSRSLLQNLSDALMPWDAGVVLYLFTLRPEAWLSWGHDWPPAVPPLAGSLPLCSPWPLTFSFLPSSLPVTSFFHYFASLPLF